MPSIHLSYVNIALDAFALAVMVILFASCLGEFRSRSLGAKHFLILQIAVTVALVADMIAWIGEGHASLATVTLVANTVATCACQIAITEFMGYLVASLYANSRAARCVLNVFRVLCVCSIAFYVANAFIGCSFEVSTDGHWHHKGNALSALMYLAFPILSFLALTLMTFLAKSSAKVNRVVFFVYTLFPVAGLIADYAVHGISLTYVGFTVSILVIYTNIYLTRQKQLQEQRSALMLSQINPHFIYNTLSTIAAMCDTSPKQAQYLTIDFSQYLRRNISTLSSDGLIPFEQEMEHVACYLKIEKARFRERLNVNYSIQCKDFSIPPLTVQPLVENAVKHGVSKKAEGGTVKVSTYDGGTHYVIEIIDDGVGFEAESAEMHVGIENVRSRVASMCKGDLTVKSTPGVGTRVTVEIPKRAKKKGKRQ